LIQEKTVLFEELEENFRMVGVSPQLTKIVNTIKTIAETKAKVLITGESGTGKELIAWAVHHNSKRSGKPYIKLNCASIPEELLESELFGHKKGSFTGAYNNYKGKFIAADGGTLFLDEIGDMSINLQSKLLRVLEDEEVQAVGESASVKIDVRIVAATNKNLEVEILNGKFREDLYHRLNVVKIEVPPLRERKEDILPISYLFLRKYTDIYNKKISSFSPKTEAYLNNNPWRGNVRELRNFIEKCVLFAKRNEIGFDVVSEIISTKFDAKEEVNNENLRIAKNKFEREHIISVLNKHNWKVLETATALGIDRAHLFKKMKQLSIEK
jgi:transcriptional regulator with GAF, ATPase, and Fis domain